MMNKNKKGFTISELLIALGVIAVLTAVLMPIIHGLIPDQNTLMAKRAFYTTETIVSNIINDNNCYPVIRGYSGFEDGRGYKKCDGWNQTNSNDPGEKFATLLLDKYDKREAATKSGGDYVFNTKDGMRWVLKAPNFSSNSSTTLIVDVDGPNQGPNCGQAEASGECAKIGNKERTKGFDKFTMTIQPNGKIIIEDCWAIQAAKIDKKLIGTFEEGSNCDGQNAASLNNYQVKPQSITNPCCSEIKNGNGILGGCKGTYTRQS